MDDDELRRRLERIDPLPDGPETDPITSPRARQLLENIMTAPIHPSTDAMIPEAPPPPFRRTGTATPDRGRRRLALLGAAAALIAAVAVGAALIDRGDDSTVAGPGTGDVLELSAGDIDPALMSCMPISAETVAMSPIAFRAIVDSVDGEVVTMTVDRWYRGGDAETVTLTSPMGMEALIGGVDFTVGEPVLITAFDGVVSYCGMSGPATPELQAIFEQAFQG